MIRDYGEARAVAERFLDDEIRPDFEEELILIDSGIVETPDVWVFPYDTRIYAETLEVAHAIVGNAPIVVPKNGTEPWTPHTATPLKDQITGFGRARKVFE